MVWLEKSIIRKFSFHLRQSLTYLYLPSEGERERNLPASPSSSCACGPPPCSASAAPGGPETTCLAAGDYNLMKRIFMMEIFNFKPTLNISD